MSIPWEVFVLIISGAIGACAVLLGSTKYFAARMVKNFEDNFSDIKDRLDKINGSVQITRNELEDHKLWATDNYQKKEQCKEYRDICQQHCPAKP